MPWYLNPHLPEFIAVGGFGVLLVTMITLMVRNSAVEWDITDEFLASLDPNYRADSADGDVEVDDTEEAAA